MSFSKLKFVDRSQTPKGFPVVAPASGDIHPLNESNQPMIANSVLGEGVLIHLTGNKIVSPFDGTIEEMPPSLHRIQLKSTIGLKLLILLPEGTENFHGQGFVPKVKPGQVVRAGQLLTHFNPQLQQSLPNHQCAVLITNPELLGPMYCSAKRVTAGEDVLLMVTKKPA